MVNPVGAVAVCSVVKRIVAFEGGGEEEEVKLFFL
jgi:hypothetical protein